MSVTLIDQYRKYFPEGSIPLFIGTDNQANIGFPCTKTFRLLLFCYPLSKYLSISPNMKLSLNYSLPNEYLYILDFRLFLQHLTKGKFDLTYYLSSPDHWKHEYWISSQWMELEQYAKLTNQICPLTHCETLLNVYQPSSYNPMPILIYKLFQIRAILVTDRIFRHDPLPNPNLIQLKQYQSCEQLIDQILQMVYNPKDNPSQTYIITEITEFITKKREQLQREAKLFQYPNMVNVWEKGDTLLTKLLNYCLIEKLKSYQSRPTLDC